MDFWGVLIVIGLFALAAWGFYTQAQERSEVKDKKGKFLDHLKTVNGFKQSRVHDDKTAYLAVDVDNGRIYFGSAPEWKPTLVSAKQIMSVTIYEDGQTVTHASRLRQVGGALVGNALAGDKGAIIGGLGAKTTSVDAIKSVVLRLEIDDPRNPIIGVNFLRYPDKRGGRLYEQASVAARSFSSLITAIMRRSEAASEGTVVPPVGDRKLEDIAKLAQMRDQGVLTEQEFIREKARILGHAD